MRFLYRLRQANGVCVRGVMEAQDERDARLRLQNREGTLLMLRPAPWLSTVLVLFQRRKSIRGVIKQLALMMGASLPLRESLVLVARQQTNEAIRQMLEDVYRQVCQGVSLSCAMARQPRFFESLCCATVAAGEYSGDLAGALNDYAEFSDEQYRLRQAIQQAVSYPLFLLVASCVVIAVLLTMAVPQIISQLTLSGVALPWSTRLILALGDGLRLAMLPASCMGAVGILTLFYIRNRAPWRYRLDALMLRLPFFGGLAISLGQVRLLMTLSVLCRSAIPMADALRLSCDAIDNRCFRTRAQRVTSGIVEGETFSNVVAKEGLFPPDVLALIAAGEQGGRLSHTLSYLARMQRESLQQRLLGLVKLIEPVLILLLGLVVLLVFMAIIQPMLTMNSLAI